MGDEAATTYEVPRLRPGCRLLDVSEDKLHLAFANHTVTFTTSVVTRIVRAYVTRMDESLATEELIAAVVADTASDEGVARYVLEMLSASHCLFWLDAQPVPDDADNPLWRYYASIGENPVAMTKRLASARVVVITSESGDLWLRDVLLSAGIDATVMSVPPGALASEIATAIARHTAGTFEVMACWNFPYRSRVAQFVNDAAISGQPVLFGGCEGLVGRIGPYVLSKTTACLQCLNSRLIANGGTEELSCFHAYQRSSTDTVSEAPTTHPAFMRAMAGLFAFELSQILLKRPPQTLGVVLEYSASGELAARRQLLRVPRCPACSSGKPPRLAWNTTFVSPRVKDGANEG